jgi:hypothetical protein
MFQSVGTYLRDGGFWVSVVVVAVVVGAALTIVGAPGYRR